MKTLTFSFSPKLGVYSIDKPNEDAFRVSNKFPIAAVGDGVTLLKRSDDGSYQVFEDGESGPYKMAKVFCENVVPFLENRFPNINQDVVKESFVVANQKIREENKRLLGIDIDNPDYGSESFAITASAIALVNSKLYYGFVYDCGIAVITDDGRVKLLTSPGPKKPKTKELPSRLKQILEEVKGVRAYRNRIRNNPSFIIDGDMFSHGVLNGQEEALPFVETGEVEIEDNDTITVFSDGFYHYFELPEFLEILSKADSDELGSKLDELTTKVFRKGMSSQDYGPIRKYGTERTIVVIKP